MKLNLKIKNRKGFFVKHRRTFGRSSVSLLEYIEIEDKATILDLQKMHTGVYVILGVRYLKRALQKFQDDRAAFSLTLRHNID